MTKAEIKKRLGFETDAALAALFGISQAAVSQWPEEQQIPRMRWMQLRYELRPDVFGEAPGRSEAA